MSFRITSIIAFTAIDDDNVEGICAFHTSTGWMPMVAADPERVEQLRSIAQEIVAKTGKPVTLRRYDNMTTVEVIE